jgi:hypothetical protein
MGINMDIFLWVIGLFILSYFVVGFRAFKAQERLQACIDNGKVLFDGIHIEFSEDLSESELKKLEFERDYYIKVKRALRTIPKGLHRRNSGY